MSRKSVLVLLILSLFFASGAAAETAINCHCFKDRSYDPQQPQKVTDYLLATTQNSFFAEVFGIQKFVVVKSRMSGTTAEDLWLAYYLAGKSGIEAGSLLNARAMDGSWASVTKTLGLPRKSLGPGFAEALDSGSEDAVLAAAVADDATRLFLGGDPAAIQALRRDGATTQEVILSVFLGRRTERSATTIFADVKGHKTTWGELVASLGITPEQIEPAIAKLVK